MASYGEVIFWALVGGLFSIVGGALLLINKKAAYEIGALLTPFAAGAMLGAAFFDMLPEAVAISGVGTHAFRWAVIGITAFFLLEHYLHWFHHHHDHDEKNAGQKTPVSLVIIGDTLHNAIDGVAIGAAFAVSPAVGITTTVAIAAHEIPQEIGDFSILLKAGMRRLYVLMWNAISALATVVTAVITFRLGNSENLPLGAIVGLAAGMFIYVAASDLIPSIHADAKGKFKSSATLLFVAGVLIVAIATEIIEKYV